MKTKRVTKLFALFVAGLIISTGSLSRGQSPLPAKKIKVSKYGTLLEIFDAKGKSRFGKLTGEGFELTYDYKGKTTSVSAVGDKVVGLAAGDVKTNKQATTVITKTSDNALEITTYYFVNAKTDKLMIQRKFKNISKEPLVVKTIAYLDPAFVTGAGIVLREKGKELVAVMKSRLKLAPNPSDCLPECPDDPPVCPLPCGARIEFLVDQMTIRTNTTSDRPDSLMLPGASADTLPPNGERFMDMLVDFPPQTEIG